MTNVFDWIKVARIIRFCYRYHKDLEIEAGLASDWAWNNQVIFNNGKLNLYEKWDKSSWDLPLLKISWEGFYKEVPVSLYTENTPVLMTDREFLDIVGTPSLDMQLSIKFEYSENIDPIYWPEELMPMQLELNQLI